MTYETANNLESNVDFRWEEKPKNLYKFLSREESAQNQLINDTEQSVHWQKHLSETASTVLPFEGFSESKENCIQDLSLKLWYS